MQNRPKSWASYTKLFTRPFAHAVPMQKFMCHARRKGIELHNICLPIYLPSTEELGIGNEFTKVIDPLARVSSKVQELLHISRDPFET